VSAVLVLARWTLRRERGTLGAFALLLFLFGLVIVWVARTLDAYQGFAKLAGMIPAFVRRATGVDASLMLSFRGAVGIAYAHPAVVAILVAAAVAMGRGPAVDVDRRQTDFLLARPVPRWALVARSLIAVLAAAVLLPASLLAGTGVGLVWTGRISEVPLGTYAPLAASNAALLAALGGVTVLLAAWSGRARRTTQGAVGFALVSYVLDYLARIWEPLRPFGAGSVFRYAEPSAALAGEPVAPGVAVLLGVALASGAAALLLFDRRDV
jgi:hypothetical protein